VHSYEAGQAEDLRFFYAHIEAFNTPAVIARRDDREITSADAEKTDERGAQVGDTRIAERDAYGGGQSVAGSIDDSAVHPELGIRGDNASHDIAVPFVRVPHALVTYRYRGGMSVSAGTPRNLIRDIRVRALERQVLGTPPWSEGFGIWGAGKYGRLFYRALQPEYQAKVIAFYDVNDRKVGVARGMAWAGGRDLSAHVHVCFILLPVHAFTFSF
jgi:hypothetical protein